MSIQAPVEAITLADRIRAELPSGSAQCYATMVILNSLMTYSEKHGLVLEPEERNVVTCLSVEYLYLAWYYSVDIKLDQAQTKYWPHQVWKDSANLDINLKEIVETRQNSKHDNLRDARTLLSFGALVNRYFIMIRAQKNGLETLRNSYCPIVPGHSPILSQPSGTPNSQYKPVKLGWSWASLWNRSKSESPQMETSPDSAPLSIPGSMPPPPADLLPFSGSDTPLFPLGMESLPSASVSTESTASTSFLPNSYSSDSVWTIASIEDSTISAMDRLEAYLSVIGTPDCEEVGMMTMKTSRLVLLDEAERTTREHILSEPVRKPLEESKISSFVENQKYPWSWSTSEPSPIRWMSGEELKAHQGQADEQKVQQKVKDLKKIKPRSAKSAQLMPRRAALLQLHPEVGSSPLANPVVGKSHIIHLRSD